MSDRPAIGGRIDLDELRHLADAGELDTAVCGAGSLGATDGKAPVRQELLRDRDRGGGSARIGVPACAHLANFFRQELDAFSHETVPDWELVRYFERV